MVRTFVERPPREACEHSPRRSSTTHVGSGRHTEDPDPLPFEYADPNRGWLTADVDRHRRLPQRYTGQQSGVALDAATGRGVGVPRRPTSIDLVPHSTCRRLDRPQARHRLSRYDGEDVNGGVDHIAATGQPVIQIGRFGGRPDEKARGRPRSR